MNWWGIAGTIFQSLSLVSYSDGPIKKCKTRERQHAYYDSRLVGSRPELLIADVRVPEFRDWSDRAMTVHEVRLDRHGMHEVALGSTVHWV